MNTVSPAWTPSKEVLTSANITYFMQEQGLTNVNTFHRWTVEHFEDFWESIIKKLDIQFKKKPTQICDLSKGVESPEWLPGATFNIVDSCFISSPSSPAIIYEDENKNICSLSFGELNQLSNQVANSLLKIGLKAGDAIAICMTMNPIAVAIYLGIIKMGGVVVSIADSFSSQEIAVRLKIANTKALFTQFELIRLGKKLPLYEKIKQAGAPTTIVIGCSPDECFSSSGVKKFLSPDETKSVSSGLHLTWEDFLVAETQFVSHECQAMSPCNILFSSGTTGEPKAIVWNHSTAIKAASDAFFHQNIKTNDILCWPSNLGWMMGPWLLYAAFINRAAIALYSDVPKDKAFGEFVSRAKVTMLGVIPTLVGTWRQSQCMEQCDWSAIKVFSSTGECSNPNDMLYLMSLAGNKPIIEYCGGTEIGGAYVSSTVVQPNYPSLFSTPTMGMDFIILDETGNMSTEGEVAIIPPSIGLSTVLLNANHHHVYYEDMPLSPNGKVLRRHGDQIKQLANGYYSLLGRVDDTMNLGGIKISATEIERSLIGLPHIPEVAAIAVTPPSNGPSLLVIYAASSQSLVKEDVLKDMQKRINERINPLFKIHDVVIVPDLPKTASNKIMRRLLRDKYK